MKAHDVEARLAVVHAVQELVDRHVTDRVLRVGRRHRGKAGRQDRRQRVGRLDRDIGGVEHRRIAFGVGLRFPEIVEVGLVPDLPVPDVLGGAVAGDRRGAEPGIVGQVRRRAGPRGRHRPRPLRREVQDRQHADPARGRRADDPVRFGPVEAGRTRRLHQAPVEVEAQRGAADRGHVVQCGAELAVIHVAQGIRPDRDRQTRAGHEVDGDRGRRLARDVRGDDDEVEARRGAVLIGVDPDHPGRGRDADAGRRAAQPEGQPGARKQRRHRNVLRPGLDRERDGLEGADDGRRGDGRPGDIDEDRAPRDPADIVSARRQCGDGLRQPGLGVQRGFLEVGVAARADDIRH